ncbi:response regulator transcription factor [Funiculus sociatus GB2-A5]|jgi:two-component system NarL family response regulator|uniref:Response regulator transcription factor n=1 Tax=Funiculus sociatus GB2-A5 TaxID=2933946 RepID=A0ABV0JSE2_9CYAN|nr:MULTISPECIES: response regulator transcription factor [unclassified Trichocoleus]MBD1908939.1 response regulator transcription factor [Trichocoleus sp. FACHB-832]MBD2002333.1 response regulator transcription factor [Trichocoleus sp. FACHB-40]MBD2064588.1 response regulator transcription factor [Trichocoleus sp. FACHB-6]
MSQSNAIRVLVVDDHPVVRQGLVGMLEEVPDILVVGQAGNGQEALAVFRQEQPDATLMDLRMPHMDGVAAITAICTEFPAARIIVLTTYEGDEDIYQGLRAGAKGYLLKDAEPEELLAAIRAVHKGQKHIPPQVGAKLLERMTSPELSDRELEVLQLITTGKSTQVISKALHITERTVNFHINHILSKLGVEDRTQAVIVALRRGIVSL